MSDASNSPTYGKTPNLGWFALVHFSITVGAIVVSALLEKFGLSLPSTGVSIGVIFASSWLAGDKLASSLKDWSSDQRHQLALRYSVIASFLMVPLALIAALAGVLINGIPFEAFGAWFEQVVPFLLFGIVVGLLLNYAVGRLVLGQVAKRRGLA